MDLRASGYCKKKETKVSVAIDHKQESKNSPGIATNLPLALDAYSIICSKQRPNSSKTRPSVSTELLHCRSASSAWASKH